MNTSIKTLGFVALFALATACGSEPQSSTAFMGQEEGDGDNNPGDGDGDGDNNPGDGDGDGDNNSGDGDGDGDGGPDIKLDTLPPPGDGDGDEPTLGCKKVDLLYLIDNSYSMKDDQVSLISAFPGFITGMLGLADDLQVLVADTDADWNNQCANNTNCDWQTCIYGGYDWCWGPPSDCDKTIGAGVVFPHGPGASNVYSQLNGGNRYIVDETELEAKFPNIAQLGEGGNGGERIFDSIIAALSTELNQVNGCNEGYVRDDALLVIVVLSDTDDYQSEGDTTSRYEDIIAAKWGDSSAIVILSILDDACDEGQEWPFDLYAVFDQFENHFSGSICGDFGQFFTESLNVVGEACDDFVPVD